MPRGSSVNTPLSTDNQKVTLTVMATSEAIPAQSLATSHCVVQSQIVGIETPNRWLNGQTITLYRLDDNDNGKNNEAKSGAYARWGY